MIEATCVGCVLRTGEQALGMRDEGLRTIYWKLSVSGNLIDAIEQA
jgi:hypothetical protein